MLTISVICMCSLFVTDEKVRRLLLCSAIFY
uniref:Uncharacterized protein n=1 Tax=Lepeophtheirus salmonis TaxID=72036 RepID=A0A0K2SXJ5_LEPSM